MKARETLDRAKKKKRRKAGKGCVGGGTEKKACKTFFNGPGIPSDRSILSAFVNTCKVRDMRALHVRDYEESKLCRILQECLQHFPQLTSPSTCFKRLSYYTFKVFWRI